MAESRCVRRKPGFAATPMVVLPPSAARKEGWSVFRLDRRIGPHRPMHYVALLRGINLGKRRLKMDRLRELFVEQGFHNVATFIASGNVIFESDARSAAKLEARIEAHLQHALGYAVDTFVRSRAELAAVGAIKFAERTDPGPAEIAVNVGFCKVAAEPAAMRQLAGVRTAVDRFEFVGREFFWFCRTKISESTVWSLPEVRAIPLPNVTLRNLNTVRRIAAEFPPP